jgi:hypothetical protein
MNARRLILSVLATTLGVLGLTSAPALGAGPPTVDGQSVTAVTRTAASIQAQVNPEGFDTHVYVEYGETGGYGSSTAPVDIGSESTDQSVTTTLSGLRTGVTYHFRVVATSEIGGKVETVDGPDVEFTTVPPVRIGGVSSPSVGVTEATVRTEIEAFGTLTSYRVEYSTGAEPPSFTQEASVGAPQGAVFVVVRLSGLRPGAEYHLRFIATNTFGTIRSETATLTTEQSVTATALALPDNREYELVSSPSENISLYDPDTTEENEFGEDFTEFGQPFRAATDGDSVAYGGEPTVGAGNGAFGKGQSNELLATRGSTGWTARDLTPPRSNSETVYEYLSSDLSVGILRSLALVSQASPPAPTECGQYNGYNHGFGLYSGTGGEGGYHSLVTGTQLEGCGEDISAGASADGSHLIFETEPALLPQAKAGLKVKGDNNLYDSVGGQLYQVNVLPDGQPEASPAASFGAPPIGGEGVPDLSNVVSADGSRIFWSSDKVSNEKFELKSLYVRENDTAPQSPIENGKCIVPADACTLSIAEGGRYWTASSDGSEAFFTKEGGLYEFDVETQQTITLVPSAGSVASVIGTSEDGSRIYFVAGGVLAENENSHKEKAEAGGANLYLRQNGATMFIASGVNAAYYEIFGNKGPGGGPRSDLSASLGERVAEVTPDGSAIAFLSRKSLTGYDNEGLPEAFVFDASTGQLSCASCDPSGAPPPASEMTDELGGGVFLSNSNDATFMERFVSDDGSRVFFETKQSLVPQDTDGLQDVYEWERNGAGSCPAVGSGAPEPGCVYLLSGGNGSDNSYFVDADATGENVFFTSRGRLTPQVRNETVALYDARVNGGFPETSLSCTGTGCQGVPPAPPIFATPSSVTFSGVGNFPYQPPVVVTPKSKSSKCRKGFTKKKGRCVKTKTRRRARAKKTSNKRRAKR